MKRIWISLAVVLAVGVFISTPRAEDSAVMPYQFFTYSVEGDARVCVGDLRTGSALCHTNPQRRHTVPGREGQYVFEFSNPWTVLK